MSPLRGGSLSRPNGVEVPTAGGASCTRLEEATGGALVRWASGVTELPWTNSSFTRTGAGRAADTGVAYAAGAAARRGRTGESVGEEGSGFTGPSDGAVGVLAKSLGCGGGVALRTGNVGAGAGSCAATGAGIGFFDRRVGLMYIEELGSISGKAKTEVNERTRKT
jgi:hypothetical protein